MMRRHRGSSWTARLAAAVLAACTLVACTPQLPYGCHITRGHVFCVTTNHNPSR